MRRRCTTCAVWHSNPESLWIPAFARALRKLVRLGVL